MRTEIIALRVDPKVKAATRRAAADDHRSMASLVEKLLVEYLNAAGYLKASVAPPAPPDD